MRHVSTLREHIIQIAKPLLSRLLFVLDVSVHLLALTVDVSNDLPLVRNPGLLLFHETIRDALDLRSNRIQSIVMVLDPVLLLLDQSRLKLIPTSPSPSIYQLQNSFKKAMQRALRPLTYILSWLWRHVSLKISPSSLS